MGRRGVILHMSYVTTNGPTRVCTHVCLAVSSRSTQPDILGGSGNPRGVSRVGAAPSQQVPRGEALGGLPLFPGCIADRPLLRRHRFPPSAFLGMKTICYFSPRFKKPVSPRKTSLRPHLPPACSAFPGSFATCVSALLALSRVSAALHHVCPPQGHQGSHVARPIRNMCPR